MSRPLPMLTALRRRKKLLPTAFSGGGVSAYAVNSFDPDTVADFAGVLNSGTEYYRVGGTATTFASMFTHTRASNATMVDSDGNLKWAPHNLLTYSNTFDNVAWTKSNCSVVGGVSDPDGGSSAWTLTATANNGFLYQATSFPTGSDVTNGIWVRRRTGTGSVELRSPNNTTGNTLSVTSEWQLFGFEGDSNNIGSVRLSLATNGDAVDIYAARVYRSDLGGMVNNPDRGDSYVPTTSAARYLPRRNHYRYNGASFVKKGILLESAASTNLIPYSNDFENAWWATLGSGSSTANNSSSGPDGETSMALYTEGSASTARHGIGGNTPITQTSGATHSVSFYVKNANTRYVTVGAVNATNSFYVVTFDLVNKVSTQDNVGSTSGTILAKYVEDVGNDILRLTVVGSMAGLNIYPVIYAATSGTPTIGALGGELMNGRSQASFYVSHADCILGNVCPSSHIATSGATATRAAETKAAAGSNLDASTTAMSFHLAGEENYADLATAGQVELFDWRVDANNRITVTIDTDGAKTGTITLTMVSGGSSASVAATTQLTPGVNKAFNVAWRVTTSEINIALNGTAATATATAIGVPDLSSVAAAFEGRGTRSLFRQAAVDWTDAGIEEASA